MDHTSRREFLQTSALMMSGPWLAAYMPAIRRTAADVSRQLAAGSFAFEFFTPEEARDAEAIAAQIFPTDDTPGAREAGVVEFMDRALSTFMAPLAEPVRAGLAELSGGRERPFGLLTDREQKAALAEAEGTAFFEAIHLLTVVGMFADPSYGGNRGRIGWDLLGFDGVFAYSPPFGYYDRDRHGAGQ